MSCLILLLMLSVVHAAREEDRVTYLPGLAQQPTFKHYAGYLSASESKKMFYWFVESENNPQQDPVVLWLNGGPGCSSLTGFLVELGPWRVTPDGQNLTWFEQRWNKIANIIFLESPVGVGYSYHTEGILTASDNQTAYDNHMALRDFFAGFPEYKNNDFYVTGESYAGIYVPMLSARIVDDPDFPFKGLAVGNGVTDRSLMNNGLVPYQWGRGLFGTDMYNGLIIECCGGVYSKDCNFDGSSNPVCNDWMRNVSNIAWRIGLNPYHVYQPCYGGVPNADGVIAETEDSITLIVPDSISMRQKDLDRIIEYQRNLETTKQVRSTIPCTDTSDRETYLNKPEVREAIHVPSFVQQWQACSSAVSANYSRQYTDLTPFYEYVFNKDPSYEILVFNGDLDMACNHVGDHWFMERFAETNQLQRTQAYRDWHYTEEDQSTQIGGFGEQWGNITFLTVLGAGHFVPTDAPRAAYRMWQGFLQGSAFFP